MDSPFLLCPLWVVAVTVAAKADGTDLVGIVASGVPHVTIATAHRVQAVESIDVLKVCVSVAKQGGGGGGGGL